MPNPPFQATAKSGPRLNGEAFGCDMRILDCILLASLVVAVVGCGTRRRVPGGCTQFFVSFPSGQARRELGERVEAVELTVQCGSIAAINHIPRDWLVSVEWPEGELTTLKMVAGHGVSMLSDDSDLEQFATLLKCDCALERFSVRGSLAFYYWDGLEHERSVSFDERTLVIDGL